MMVLCGFLLGAAGQVVKLCADTAMQIDVDDALRGHVFAVQDALFWMSFIVALTAAAAVIPADGRSPGLVVAGSAVYLRRAGGACIRRPPLASPGLGCAAWRQRLRSWTTSAPRATNSTRWSPNCPPPDGPTPPRRRAGPSPTRSPICCGPTGSRCCRSTDEAGFAEVLGAAAADPSGFVDRGAEEIAAAAARRSAGRLAGAPGHRLHDALLDRCPTAASCPGSVRR